MHLDSPNTEGEAVTRRKEYVKMPVVIALSTDRWRQRTRAIPAETLDDGILPFALRRLVLLGTFINFDLSV